MKNHDTDGMIMISLRYYLEHEAHSETYGLRRDIDTCEIGWLGWCASDDYAWSTTRHYEPQEKSLWRESVQKKGRPEIGGCRLGRSPQRTNTESFFLHYLFMLTLPNMDRCGRAAQDSLSTKNIESSTFNNIATIRNLCIAAFLLNVEL